MAQAASFDTLYYTKKFEEAGCSQELAETQTLLMTEIINNYVCTKYDLFHTELELKNAFKNSQHHFEIKLKETEAKIKAAESRLELRIKDAESRLELRIKEIEIRLAKVESEIIALKKDIAEIHKEISGIKASIHTYIARWVLGTSALQTTILLTFVKSFLH